MKSSSRIVLVEMIVDSNYKLRKELDFLSSWKIT